MAVIERVEIRMVDLQPKVKRSTRSSPSSARRRRSSGSGIRDGAVGTGYTYTIGTGGHAIVEAAGPLLVPGADRPRRRPWSSRSGAISSSSPTPPRSVRSPRWRWPRSTPPCGTCAAARPVCRCMSWPAAPRSASALYTTEGGWLHIETAGAGRGCAGREGAGLRRRQAQGRPAAARGRAAARGGPRGGRRRLRDLHRRQPGLRRRRGDPPRTPLRGGRHRLAGGAAAGRRSRRPCPAGAVDHASRSPSARASTAICISASICSAAPVRSCRSTWRASAASRPGSRPRIWPRPSMSRSARTS